MLGHDALIAARLERLPVAVVDIDVGGKPDAWRYGKGWHFRLAVEAHEAGSADLRCCHRLPVFVHADSYEAGYPFFERAAEFDPLALHLCAPEIVLRYDGERLEQLWAR